MDQFEAMKVGPKRAKVTQWLDSWDVLMIRGKELDLYFMRDGVAYRAFLKAIKHLEPAWAASYATIVSTALLEAPLLPIHELPGVPKPLELSRAFRRHFYNMDGTRMISSHITKCLRETG